MQEDIIAIPRHGAISVALAPVQNFIGSLVMLCRFENFPGLNNYLVDVFRGMSEEEKDNNKIMGIGLYYGFLSTRIWTSVEEYLQSLESMPPEQFVERLFSAYAKVIHMTKTKGKPGISKPAAIDQANILKDVNSYLEFVKDNFEYIDIEAETLSYEYIVNPPLFKEFVIDHLNHMWRRYLSAEWEKNKSMLQESVTAFQQLNLSKLDRLDAAEVITGHRLEDEWQDWPWKVEWYKRLPQVFFVPTAHTGPYILKMSADETLFVFFNARQPEGTPVQTSDLNRNEINVRMNALADDTRLQILKLISEKGELSSQEIMAELRLSQSAASRHLKQLSATGYLYERRKSCAKQYQLNDDFVQRTLSAVSNFLKNKQSG